MFTVGAHHRSWAVDNEAALADALAYRDSRGGSIFWMGPENQESPVLAIRVSGELATAHFFPEEGHPGFQCIGGAGLPKGGLMTFIYDGCDPGTGEETPNEYVIPFATARRIAEEFLRTGRMWDGVEWDEL